MYFLGNLRIYMYEARYVLGNFIAYTILAGFIHVVCLGISNKSVAVYANVSDLRIHVYMS